MKAKSLNSTGHQQKSKAVDNKLRLVERKKQRKTIAIFMALLLCAWLGFTPLPCLRRVWKEANFYPVLEGHGTALGTMSTSHPARPHSVSATSTLPQNSLSLGCSAQTHSWIVRKRTKKMSRIICTYLMFSIVHLLHGFHIHAVLRGESFDLCCKSYTPALPSFLHVHLLPNVLIFFSGIAFWFPIPIEQ